MKNVEQTSSSYLFHYKVNLKRGSFPHSDESRVQRFKRKIGNKSAMSLAEAGSMAKRWVIDIEHLQTVSNRDLKGLPNSTKDIQRAAATWLWLIDWSPELVKALSDKRTEASYAIHLRLQHHAEAVKSIYTTSDYPRLYTPLGDEMLRALEGSGSSAMFSDALPIWQEETNRAHLTAETSKSVADAKRIVGQFIEFAGDRALDQINKKLVKAYIDERLKHVKTTSVEREITALRAIWNRAADHFEIKTRNPFERPPIKGLGTDAVKRESISLIDTITLLKSLDDTSVTTYVKPLIGILVLTGMRLAEAWGLEETDWDKERQTLHVRPNSIRGLKSKHSARPIPVMPPLERWLSSYFDQRRASTSNSASATVCLFLKRVNQSLSAHSLRHGFKDRLIEADATGLQIEELQGWSDQSMVRHYGTNAVTEQKRNLMAKVYRRLDPEEAQAKVIQIRA